MMEAVWTHVSARLQERLEPGHYKVWIQPLAGHFDGTGLVVHAVSAFAAGFVRDNFMAAIREAVRDVTGEDIPVRLTDVPFGAENGREDGRRRDPERAGEVSKSVPALIVSPAVVENPPVSPLVAEPGRAWQPVTALQVEGQHALPLRYDEKAFSISSRQWRHSFEDFVVGPSNELAFAASRSICKESRGADILFLSSGPGLGKTHLVQAVGQQLYKECNYRAPKVEYLTAEEFASRLVMSFKGHDTDRFKSRYRDVDVLLLEDVHFLQGKEKIQEELLATLKTLQDRGSKVLFSSSFIPRDLQGMGGELLSRLHSGFLAVIDRPDRDTRKRIFREKARLNQVILPEDVSDFLADNIDSDVRQIESCLRNLALKAKLLRCDITMQMAWEAVQYYAPCEKKLDLEKIIAYVSRGYGISSKEMRSKSRKKDLVVARNTVFFLARKHTDLSLEEIGTIFGRSHSTVIKGITSLEREMSRETSLGRQIAGAISLIERNGGIISPSS
ncbi:MAG: AAA family ATPase [Deltaproteobacteria bacterium]|nr:AAA family ATPase [Deltaproteobacteria bacterium]